VIRRRASLACQVPPRLSFLAMQDDTPGGPAGQVFGAGLTVDPVNLFPGRVGYSIRARGRSWGALGESRSYLFCCQRGYRLVWPKPRRRGEGFLRGEEVVQKDIVHL